MCIIDGGVEVGFTICAVWKLTLHNFGGNYLWSIIVKTSNKCGVQFGLKLPASHFFSVVHVPWNDGWLDAKQICVIKFTFLSCRRSRVRGKEKQCPLHRHCQVTKDLLYFSSMFSHIHIAHIFGRCSMLHIIILSVTHLLGSFYTFLCPILTCHTCGFRFFL